MGIFFKPDMTTAVEVPPVEAVLLLQRQIMAASRLGDDEAPRELRRGDVDELRRTLAGLREGLRT